MSTVDDSVIPLARYLAHSLWQGGVILLGYLACRWWLRGARADARYRASAIAVVLLVLLPLFTALVPEDPAPSILTTPLSGVDAITTGLIHWTRDLADHLTLGFARLVATVWGLGVLLSLARSLSGLIRLQQLIAGARPASGLADLDRLAGLAGLHSPPPVLESPVVGAPCVAGWRRALVLVPVGLTDSLQPEEFRAVLLHEFAHVRRNDAGINLALRLLSAFAWHQPGLGTLRRDLQREREQACDELAVQATGRPLSLARGLLALEARRLGQPRLALAGTGGDLGRRVRRLLAWNAEHASPPAGARLLLSLGTLLVLTSFTTLLAGRTEAELAALRSAHALIQAQDPAGRFTVELIGDRLVAATIAGEMVPVSRIIQQGRRVRLLDAGGSPALTLDVPGPGRIRWDPRPPPGP